MKKDDEKKGKDEKKKDLLCDKKDDARPKEVKEVKEKKEVKEMKEVKEVKEVKETKEAEEAKELKELKDPKELEKQLEECRKKKEEYLEGWKKERANFLNYKKDEIERIETLIKYANEEMILKFLPVLDNIYLAEKEITEELKNHKWTEGVMNIKTQMLNFLKSQGVEEIKAVGEKFDPNFHEAIEEVVVEGKESGTIVEEIQKGYKLNGRIIRPAKVKVIK